MNGNGSIVVDVRQVTHREGIGKSSKEAYAMDVVSAIVSNDDGTEAMGDFILPKGHARVERGVYHGRLTAYGNRGKLEWSFSQLTPVPKSPPK